MQGSSASPHSLRSVEQALRSLLRARSRTDIDREALERVAFTDDGSTLYVHIFAKPAWPHRRPGQAYVLSFAEKRDLRRLSDARALLREAWLQLQDEIEDVIRWFDGG